MSPPRQEDHYTYTQNLTEILQAINGIKSGGCGASQSVVQEHSVMLGEIRNVEEWLIAALAAAGVLVWVVQRLRRR